MTPSLLRRLHKIIQDGAGDAGAWKRTDNDIIELAAGQPPRVRFKPTAALATPHAIDELCMRYRAKVGAEIKKEAERELKPFYPDDAEGSTPIAYRGHGPFAARHLIAALMSP